MNNSISTSATAEKFVPLRNFWNQLKPREKRLSLLALLVLIALFLWWIALAPALKIIQTSPQQHTILDKQIQNMLSLQRDAKVLQGQPKKSLADATKSFQDLVALRLANTGQLSVTGNRAVLSLKNANAQALTDLLTQARVNAHAVPAEAKIARSSQANGGWDGSVTFNLPNQ